MYAKVFVKSDSYQQKHFIQSVASVTANEEQEYVKTRYFISDGLSHNISSVFSRLCVHTHILQRTFPAVPLLEQRERERERGR